MVYYVSPSDLLFHIIIGMWVWPFDINLQSLIYKLKAARAKRVINFHDNFFLLWCFCPCCILCPSQMEQIYIWPRLTQKQHDVCSLLFFAHIVSLFSLSFWNLACTHSPVGNIMSKLQFGTLKRSSFKLHTTLWISWFSTVGCAGWMESIVSVMEHDIKAEFFFKKEERSSFIVCATLKNTWFRIFLILE